METTEKRQVLTELLESVMRCNTCGNYIDMSYIKGLKNPEILWDIDLNKYGLVAYTGLGLFRYNYDFDFDFDENLNQFVEGLQEFLYNQIV